MDRRDHRASRSARALARLALLAVALPLAAGATIELPDHVIYGSASVFGVPAAPGTVIQVRAVPDGSVLASYPIGRNPRLGGQFALAIAMDAIDPRTEGRSRPGDPVELWVGAQLGGRTTVGSEGVAVRFDIDPQFLGTGPALSVADAAIPEGHTGTRTLSFPVTTNTTSNVAVNVDWETVDGSATSGAACGPEVDFLWAAGTAAIAPQQQATSIDVTICGDALIEPDETFTIELSGIQNAVLATLAATGTILDDDNVPSVDVADARALEPASGTALMLFRARLSRTSSHDVLFNYQTEDGTALAGLDYQAAAGTLTIPSGAMEASIAITLLPNPVVEADKTFSLLLSNPSQATLAREASTGTIVDPAFDPAVDPRDGVGSEDVDALKNPSAIAVSPDGRHLYATSDFGDGVLWFQRQEGNGDLQFLGFFANGSDGALLDGPADVVVSGDGAHVYVASRNSDAIVGFGRDPATGQLSWLGNQVDGSAGVSGLDGVVALALSPDGRHLYAVGRTAGAVVAFARDAATGTLGFIGTELDAGVAGGSAVDLEQPTALVVAPDGGQVYVASRSGNAVQTFARDATTGSLSFTAAARNGLDGVVGLSGANGLAISPDGAQLYVLALGSNSVALLHRDADGSLSPGAAPQVWASGSGVPGLQGPSAIAMTADGTELYVTGQDDGSLTIFSRSGDGLLSVRQTIFDDQGSVTDMAGPVALAVSPDDRNIYVAANLDHAIVVFLRRAFIGIFDDGFDD